VVKPRKLAFDKFLLSLKLAPRLAVEILIENPKKEILLIKRINRPYKGYWHLPGGFLLKNEKIKDCTERLSVEELGKKILFKNGKFVGLFETVGIDPRGHFLHYVVKFKLNISADKFSAQGMYFKKLPKLLIPYQRDFLKDLGYK
jgi:ADP-ribose pyrophosphatase YjhB (NUDIX family)